MKRTLTWVLGVALAVAGVVGGVQLTPFASLLNIRILSTDPTAPVGPTVYFFSDWRTATGSSTAALGDGGKWPWCANTGCSVAEDPAPSTRSEVRVTASDSRDYPTTNYLRINVGNTAPNDGMERGFENNDNFIPTTAVEVGDSLAIRFYINFRVPNTFTADDETHGFYFMDTGSGSGWGPGALGGYWLDYDLDPRIALSTWLPTIAPGQGSTPTDTYFSCEIANVDQYLAINTTYRFEWMWIRVTSTTYRLRARYYNQAGTLLCSTDSSHFTSDWYGPPGNNLSTTTFTLAGGGGAGSNTMRGFKLGVNGAMFYNGIFAETAGVAVCSSWCGAYPIAGVEN